MSVLQEQKTTSETPCEIIFSVCLPGDGLINKVHKTAYIHSLLPPEFGLFIQGGKFCFAEWFSFDIALDNTLPLYSICHLLIISSIFHASA